MSQDDFGRALGVSRQTMGRIEHSEGQLDRRTELAMRYIAEGRLGRLTALGETHKAVAGLLGQAAMGGRPPRDYTERLQAAVVNWRGKQGNAKAEPLLSRAEGLLGALNATTRGDPSLQRTVEELRELKAEWDAVSPIA